MDVGRLDLDAIRRDDPRAGDRAVAEQRGAERRWRGSLTSAQPVGPVVHEVADGAEVALGGEAALGDDEDPRAEALDLVEDVARHDDGAVGPGAEPPHEVDEVQPLARVEAVERLVEHEDLRVVDEGGGDLDPLAVALGQGAHRAAIAGVQLDDLEGRAPRPPPGPAP